MVSTLPPTPDPDPPRSPTPNTSIQALIIITYLLTVCHLRAPSWVRWVASLLALNAPGLAVVEPWGHLATDSDAMGGASPRGRHESTRALLTGPEDLDFEGANETLVSTSEGEGESEREGEGGRRRKRGGEEEYRVPTRVGETARRSYPTYQVSCPFPFSFVSSRRLTPSPLNPAPPLSTPLCRCCSSQRTRLPGLSLCTTASALPAPAAP